MQDFQRQTQYIQYSPISISQSVVSPKQMNQFSSFKSASPFPPSIQTKQIVQSPIQYYPQLVKQIPFETERVGGICSSYKKKSNGQRSAMINLTEGKNGLNSNYSNFHPATNIYTDSTNNHQYTSQKEIGSSYLNNGNQLNNQHQLQFSSQSQPILQQQYRPQELSQSQYQLQFIPQLEPQQQQQIAVQQLNNKPLVNQKVFASTPQLVPSQTQKIISSGVQKAAVSLGGNQNIGYSGSALNTYSTPVRVKEEHLTLQDVQQQLNQNEIEKKKPVEESDRCKIFSEEFLEHRERDFKRRIENLELQKQILADQLKQKEEEVERLLLSEQKFQQVSQDFQELQHEKATSEVKLVEEIEKLNSVVEQLTEQNNQLQFNISSIQGHKRF